MKNPLIGAWQLISWEISYSDNRSPTKPYGSDPHGIIMYSDNGYMSAAIARNNRPNFDPSIGLRQQKDEDLANAYRSYFHYSGSYQIVGNYVHHHVTQSLNPNFVGSVQKRKIELDNNQLTLSGIDYIDNGSIERVHRLCWKATQ